MKIRNILEAKYAGDIYLVTVDYITEDSDPQIETVGPFPNWETADKFCTYVENLEDDVAKDDELRGGRIGVNHSGIINDMEISSPLRPEDFINGFLKQLEPYRR